MADQIVCRRLAAIRAADMVGYSRLMEADEAGTIARQKAHREELIDPKIAEYYGRIVKLEAGLIAGVYDEQVAKLRRRMKEGGLNDASHTDLLARFMDFDPRLWRGCRADVEDHPLDQRRVAALSLEGLAAFRVRFTHRRRSVCPSRRRGRIRILSM